jgi:cytochrome c oxidase subunit 2
MFWLSAAQAQSLMPTQATEVAEKVTNLYSFLLISSFISSMILIGGMIYFVYKYRRKSANDKTPRITHNNFLEFLWSFIPLILFMVIFAWGWNVFHAIRTMPKDALEVHIIGKQWAWEVQYKSGVASSNLVVVPVDTDVKLIMTSRDVIHSFYVPSFRIKQDVVPGRYTTLWFNSNKLGEFHIFCAEYCGTSHSGMIGTMKVVSREDYDKWLEEEANVSTLPLAERGAKLFQVKACASCHSNVDKTTKVGPGLFQKFGTIEHTDKGDVKVDEDYVRESVLIPNAKIVNGFNPNIMPSFQGQLNETEIAALIEYIKSLK